MIMTPTEVELYEQQPRFQSVADNPFIKTHRTEGVRTTQGRLSPFALYHHTKQKWHLGPQSQINISSSIHKEKLTNKQQQKPRGSKTLWPGDATERGYQRSLPSSKSVHWGKWEECLIAYQLPLPHHLRSSALRLLPGFCGVPDCSVT